MNQPKPFNLDRRSLKLLRQGKKYGLFGAQRNTELIDLIEVGDDADKLATMAMSMGNKHPEVGLLYRDWGVQELKFLLDQLQLIANPFPASTLGNQDPRSN